MATSEPKPVAIGYPIPSSSSAYTAPPPYYPPPPHPQTYDYAPYNPSPYPHFRRFILAFVFVLLSLFLLALIYWFSVRPRLPSFSVSSLAVSSFNLSSTNLSAALLLSLSVRNPNSKLSVSYEHLLAEAFLGPDLLSETSLPPFSQTTHNSTLISATLSPSPRYLDPDFAAGILREKADSHAVFVNLRIFARMRFTGGWWKTERHPLRVYCDDLKIGFVDAAATRGVMAGPPKDCLVTR